MCALVSGFHGSSTVSGDCTQMLTGFIDSLNFPIRLLPPSEPALLPSDLPGVEQPGWETAVTRENEDSPFDTMDIIRRASIDPNACISCEDGRSSAALHEAARMWKKTEERNAESLRNIIEILLVSEIEAIWVNRPYDHDSLHCITAISPQYRLPRRHWVRIRIRQDFQNTMFLIPFVSDRATPVKCVALNPIAFVAALQVDFSYPSPQPPLAWALHAHSDPGDQGKALSTIEVTSEAA